MSKKQSSDALNKRTMVRSYIPIKLELAIEAYMNRKGIKKGEAIEEFLMGSKTLQEEVKRIEKFYEY